MFIHLTVFTYADVITANNRYVLDVRKDLSVPAEAKIWDSRGGALVLNYIKRRKIQITMTLIQKNSSKDGVGRKARHVIQVIGPYFYRVSNI